LVRYTRLDPFLLLAMIQLFAISQWSFVALSGFAGGVIVGCALYALKLRIAPLAAKLR
jgi:hypothetical protein